MDIYSVSKRGLSGSKGKRGKRSAKRTSKRVSRRRVKRTKRMRTKRNSKRVSRRRNVKNVKRKSRRHTKRRVNRRNRRVLRGGRPGRELADRLDLARDPIELDARMRREIPSEIFRGELELFAEANARYIMNHSASSVAGRIIAEKELDDLGVENSEEIQAIVREKRYELQGQRKAKAAEVDLEQKGDEAEERRAAMEEEEMTGSKITKERARDILNDLHISYREEILELIGGKKFDEITRGEKSTSIREPKIKTVIAALGYSPRSKQANAVMEILSGLNGTYATRIAKPFLLKSF
tara:strand:- start:348 stop:1235 length:888 start_codon:yes stop_codon:yes gene_type:complete